jgi:hypothetical protein
MILYDAKPIILIFAGLIIVFHEITEDKFTIAKDPVALVSAVGQDNIADTAN